MFLDGAEYCDEADKSMGGRSDAREAPQEPGGQRKAGQNRDGDSSNPTSLPVGTDDVGSEGTSPSLIQGEGALS